MDTSITRAIAALGSQERLGALLGLSQQAISYRLKHGKELSVEEGLTLERNSGGAITRKMLWPDLFSGEAA